MNEKMVYIKYIVCFFPKNFILPEKNYIFYFVMLKNLTRKNR